MSALRGALALYRSVLKTNSRCLPFYFRSLADETARDCFRDLLEATQMKDLKFNEEPLSVLAQEETKEKEKDQREEEAEGEMTDEDSDSYDAKQRGNKATRQLHKKWEPYVDRVENFEFKHKGKKIVSDSEVNEEKEYYSILNGAMHKTSQYQLFLKDYLEKSAAADLKNNSI